MKELSVEEQIYLCKYHDVDTALAKTMHINSEEIEKLIQKYKENGLYEQYRNLSDEEYEEIINKEKQIKKYNKNNKMYSKEAQILNKYNFDKNKETYKYFLRMLSEAEEAKKNNKEFTLATVFKKIGYETNTKEYNIQNECNRYLIKTYTENKELFLKHQYKQKPSIREFILKKINLNKEAEEIKTLQAEQMQQARLNTNPNSNITLNDNLLILVPIKLIEEYFYMKRIYRCKRKS